MFKLAFWTALGLLWLTAAAHSRTDTFVQRYFQNLNSLQADFVQTVFDDQDRLIETSKGKLVMQKPRRFRWDYQSPFTQLIVADGERLWVYDSELQQVTVKPLDTALRNTPLALLSGTIALHELFEINPITAPDTPQDTPQDKLHWYALRAKQTQDEFNQLRVAFNGETLAIIELTDSFNQRTRIEFSALQPNVEIAPGLLRFEPPEGTDIVGEHP